MTISTLTRTEMINKLDNEGLPRHIAESYCDTTLMQILNGEGFSQVKVSSSPSLYSIDEEKKREHIESRRQQTIKNGHLGGMHRIAACLTKTQSEESQC
ncbi:hypothetical protein AB4140_00935 [Shewanella sp. 10N.286.51.B2]|uniref:hypothetical protein n=1 Tax=Shewanella sp. 10N.286.51.B2 TaxID=3229707 RepID=UPI0035529EA6